MSDVLCNGYCIYIIYILFCYSFQDLFVEFLKTIFEQDEDKKKEMQVKKRRKAIKEIKRNVFFQLAYLTL